jgi:hypothetical protein
VLGVANGVPDRLDEKERKKRIKALGNAVVPQLIYELLADRKSTRLNSSH